jgi:hypothetical protein
MLYICVPVAFHAMQNKLKWLKIESLNVVLRNQSIFQEKARKYKPPCITDRRKEFSKIQVTVVGGRCYISLVADDSKVASRTKCYANAEWARVYWPYFGVRIGCTS